MHVGKGNQVAKKRISLLRKPKSLRQYGFTQSKRDKGGNRKGTLRADPNDPLLLFAGPFFSRQFSFPRFPRLQKCTPAQTAGTIFSSERSRNNHRFQLPKLVFRRLRDSRVSEVSPFLRLCTKLRAGWLLLRETSRTPTFSLAQSKRSTSERSWRIVTSSWIENH